ncbi:bacterial luciferase-like protein [Polychaeton citri CBS 116435]|uniref:Bacterial luciferase-like protein n=1 Tax=Polychaeton citri CBS 116435 TaxID=1314669 RepID=A0A9P4QDE7_9PEZI|nr:bacterial luciferase-like protein [Polychaeton citri CBS 116435]
MGSSGNNQQQQPSGLQRPWIMNAFAMTAPGHLAPGLWRHPSQEPQTLDHWVRVAKLLDDNSFHGIFFADVLGIYDVYRSSETTSIPIGSPNGDSNGHSANGANANGISNSSNGQQDHEQPRSNPGPSLRSGAQVPILDVSLLVSALAYATKNISFGITASTSYEHPYSLARRFATLDHLTNGRVGWNIVTSYLDSAARAYGLPGGKVVEHDERYRRAEEFMEVVYKLLEGTWRDDAVYADKRLGVWANPRAVRSADHNGKYFTCNGPSIIHPSPQRTPFLLQAGASKAGKLFAARHAEAMFLPGMIPAKTRAIVDDTRELLKQLNRPQDSLKFIAGIYVCVAETDEQAQEKFEDLLQYADLEGTAALFGGWSGTDLSQWSDDEDFSFSTTKLPAIQSMISAWTATVPGTKDVRWTKRRVLQELAISGAHPRAVGSPTTVADIMEMWISEAGVDGFNISYATTPGTFEDMIEYLWPELRRRGVLLDNKRGQTMRENFLMDGKGPRARVGHPARDYAWE